MSAGVSVVTGATRGIGRAIALERLSRGRRVLCVARDAEALARLAAEGGEGVRTFPTDLTEPSSIQALSVLAEATGQVDELVHAAGVVRYEPVGAIDPASLHAQLTLNLTVPLLLGQALGKQMAARKGGAIVFVSSTCALRPVPETTAYAASKAGQLAAMRGLAQELAPHGVRVNAVAPGVVDTDMVRAPRADGLGAEERLERLRGLHPLGRLGTPADVARAVAYLLEAEWVTGVTLGVDGGLLLG